ncbi:hypothetical protein O3P69_001557 [Scylla paramamosain]|uniref:Uncharacterized protein n=1 Tax=Scylla paramamosain TaxID=85552 RepID=A0AAW0UYR3_SCYPA
MASSQERDSGVSDSARSSPHFLTSITTLVCADRTVFTKNHGPSADLDSGLGCQVSAETRDGGRRTEESIVLIMQEVMER